jgi:hypothetical protein
MSFITRGLKGLAIAQVKPMLEQYIKGDSLDGDTIQVDAGGFSINNVVSAAP